MFTLFCYLFALVPVVAGVVLWLFNKRVVLWEVAVTAGLCFAAAAIFNWLAVKSMTDDVETWSGQVTSAIHQPAWVEAYEEKVYKTVRVEGTYYTDSNGKRRKHPDTTKRVFSHWANRTRHHGPEWRATDTLVGSYSISDVRYNDIKEKFGAVNPTPGSRSTFGIEERNSHMISGDPNDYLVSNKNNHVYPVTTEKTWENRVKAAPSLFSFKAVEPGAPVFDYPVNDDHFTSSRLLGTANGVSLYKWDQLNAQLGPSKFVNLIAVGFNQGGMGQALEQEAKWVGGKKNDLVICFGGQATAPTWAYVFGWTEKDIVKKNIESLILSKGLTDATLPELNKIVAADYVIKDWSKFDYLTVEVPFSRYIWLIVVVLIMGGGMIAFAFFNDIDKNGSNATNDWRQYRNPYNR